MALREKKHHLLISSQCVTCSSNILLFSEIVQGRLYWYQLLQEKESSRNTNIKTYSGIQNFHFYKLDFSLAWQSDNISFVLGKLFEIIALFEYFVINSGKLCKGQNYNQSIFHLTELKGEKSSLSHGLNS